MKTRILLAVLCCLATAGCQSRFAMEREVFDRFEGVTLGETGSAEVIGLLETDEETLVQNENVVASWGEREDAKNLWFNMVAFDEDTLTAARKYVQGYEHYDPAYRVTPISKLAFDAAMIVDPEVLAGPYSSESARRLVILEEVLALFRRDASLVTPASAEVSQAALLMQQTFNGLLVKLRQSPSLADRMDEPAGLEFDQMNLGESRVRMVIDGDVVRVLIRSGGWWFDEPWETDEGAMAM